MARSLGHHKTARAVRCVLAALASLLALALTTALPGPHPLHSVGVGVHRRHLLLNADSPAVVAASSVVACVARCGRAAGCRSASFSADRSVCALHTQRACDDPPVELAPTRGSRYLDVYSGAGGAALAEMSPQWRSPVCRRLGYCDPGCRALAEDVTGDCPPCAPGFRCDAGSCRVTPWHWEPQPGVALPAWQQLLVPRVHPSLLKTRAAGDPACSLKFDIRGPESAQVMIQVLDATGDQQVDITVTGSRIRLKAATPGDPGGQQEVRRESGVITATHFVRFHLDWCGGEVTLNRHSQPSLRVSVSLTGPLPIFRANKKGTGQAFVRLESGLADPWLFQPSGLLPDPAFPLTVMQGLSTKVSSLTSSLTATFDCRSGCDCKILMLSSDDPTTFIRVCFHCFTNNMRIEFVQEGVRTVLYGNKKFDLISATLFHTYRVVLNGGHVQALSDKSGSMALIAEADLPASNTDFAADRLIIGSSCDLEVRVASYHPEFATAGWRDRGVGFSSWAEEDEDRTS